MGNKILNNIENEFIFLFNWHNHGVWSLNKVSLFFIIFTLTTY